MSACMNTFGLILDILGVLLLFFFGLPPNVRRDGTGALVLEQEDQAQKNLGVLYDFLSWLALVLIVFGFGLQIYSNWI